MFDRNTEMDMTEGPLFKKLVEYAIPIMLTGILQLLFNAADLIVVGRFAGRTALAAVGSTTSLTNLLVNVFMMISMTCNIMSFLIDCFDISWIFADPVSTEEKGCFYIFLF